jgi:hypothetical protein
MIALIGGMLGGAVAEKMMGRRDKAPHIVHPPGTPQFIRAYLTDDWANAMRPLDVR